jgi:hypothetical protein
MRKKEIFWVLALLLAGWAYVHFFAHRVEKKNIVILFSLRPIRNGGRPGNGAIFPVLFQLDGYYRLTSVEAVEVLTNNPTAPEHILWHLVSASGSDPIKVFTYGQDIHGMTPYLKEVRTESLVTNVPYRLELTAGKLKGNEIFHTTVMP